MLTMKGSPFPPSLSSSLSSPLSSFPSFPILSFPSSLCLLINLHVVGPACPVADLAPQPPLKRRGWSAKLRSRQSSFLITVPHSECLGWGGSPKHSTEKSLPNWPNSCVRWWKAFKQLKSVLSSAAILVPFKESMSGAVWHYIIASANLRLNVCHSQTP